MAICMRACRPINGRATKMLSADERTKKSAVAVFDKQVEIVKRLITRYGWESDITVSKSQRRAYRELGS